MMRGNNEDNGRIIAEVLAMRIKEQRNKHSHFAETLVMELKAEDKIKRIIKANHQRRMDQ
jgi:hypothetical protein